MNKILIDLTTARQVLEALNSFPHRHLTPFISDTRTALREALAEQPAQQEPVIECDCETATSPDGSRLTKCGSDQMRRAVEEGHAFCKQPAQQQEPVDSMGMPISCGKPLCSPGDHHPLCKQAAQPAPVQEPSPTAGMNIAQRILHVGGRNNAAGYVEFGSTQAVEALVRQVLRDLPAPRVVDCHATGVCVQSGLRAEQPAQQEPVACVSSESFTGQPITVSDIITCSLPVGTELYTSPPQRKPPSDPEKNARRYLFLRNNANTEQAESAWRAAIVGRGETMDEVIDQAIEAAHGIKENRNETT